MSVNLIDSEIYGDLFGTSEMRGIFGDDVRLQAMLDVEAALARAQASLGIIPDEAAKEISASANIDIIDRAELARRTSLAGAPVMGLVSALAGACKGDAGGHVHWGATTQDIVDTGLVLQMRQGFGVITSELETVIEALAGLAENNRATIMAGRTYMQQALPISFGYKAAVWLSSLLDLADQLEPVKQRALRLQFSGAVGTLASLGGEGLKTAEALGRELDLPVPDIGWHVRRGGMAALGAFFSELAGGLGKIATDICLMSQTEIGEVAEPHGRGRGGSSTMPQKRNPVSSMLILSIMRHIQAQAGVLQNAQAHDHERATGAWQAEWLSVPQIFVLSAGALSHARFVLEGLQVDASRMRANLDLSRGLIMAEAVMMKLGAKIGHGPAHDLVEDACNLTRTKDQTFAEALKGSKDVMVHMNTEEIDKLLDPLSYIGEADSLITRVLARFKKYQGKSR